MTGDCIEYRRQLGLFSMPARRRPDILAVIPVSGQDAEFRRGVPKLAGRPLLDYTFEATRDSKLITRTIVSTDDNRIAAASRAAGMEVPFLRPPRLRRAPMAQVLRQAVEALERRDPGFRPAWIVRLQVTYPFRDRGFIDRAIRTVLTQDLDSAFCALPMYDTFWHVTGDAGPTRLTTDTSVPRARRQPIYRELAGLFSIVARPVLDRGMLHGERLGIIPTESIASSVDVHGFNGFELASLIASGRTSRRGS
jgi:N-acylneuraminate cytidylyltransferase